VPPVAQKAAPAASPARPSDALLIVFNRVPAGRRGGYAVVIGDGTLAVTALHVVRETSEMGRHESDGALTVISPYLGEACNPRVIAEDPEWDAAIIEIPWRGHPAVPLASPEETVAARETLVIRYGWPDADWSATKEERLPVHSVTIVEGVQARVSTRGYGRLAPGWSGAPMLTPDGSKLIGCFTARETANGIPGFLEQGDRLTQALSQRYAPKGIGPAADLFHRLAIKAGRGNALIAGAAATARPSQADEATAAILAAYSDHDAPVTRASVARLESFLALRPRSAFGETIHAGWLDELGDVAAADAAYARAEALGADKLTMLAASGQRLARKGDYAKALSELTAAQKLNVDGAGNLEGAIAQTLLAAGELDKCDKALTAAIERFPNNAYLFMDRACLHKAKGDREAEISDIEQTVLLFPDNYVLQSWTGMMYEDAGQLDRADAHYHAVIALAPDRPGGYALLAKMIAEKRPTARDQGISVAKRALALPNIGDSDKDALTRLLGQLEALPEPPAP
jgi:tetratricopeptide (TPR) repeat protein